VNDRYALFFAHPVEYPSLHARPATPTAGFRFIAVSPDGARAWSRPEFHDALAGPVCFGSIVRHPKAGLLFVNPDNRVDRGRRNVTVQVSRDEGKSWGEKHVLEAGGSDYADIAAARDGAALCLYERNAEVNGRWRTQALVLARLRVKS